MEKEDEVEKWIWTEADFDKMGWHDAAVHALAFFPADYEIAFDIDYILEWIDPKGNNNYYTFRVAPATLVFENVHDAVFEIESHNTDLEIDNITREDPRQPLNAEYIEKQVEWLWIIECRQGEIRFRSIGYKQFLRSQPLLGRAQRIDPKSRDFSFTRGRVDSLG